MPRVTWTGDAASAIKAQEAMAAAAKKFKEETAAAAKESRGLELAARRIEEAVNPTEKLLRKKRELAEMVAREKLSIESAGKAWQKYQQEASKASEVGRQRWKEKAEAAAQAARAQQELINQGAKIKTSLETPLEAYKRKLLELGKVYRAGAIDQQTFVRGTQQLKAELRASEPVFESVKTKSQALFGGLASQAAGAVAGFASIAAIVGEIRSQIEFLRQENEKQSQAKMTAGEAEAALRKVSATDPNRQLLIDESKRIAADRNLPLATVFQAATGAYGSSGDAKASIAMIEEATRQSRDPQSINEIASGIGFILKSSKITDSREAAGFINQVLADSPIVDQKVPQALAKVTGTFLSPVAGGSEATAGATLATLSTLAADTEGDRSRTGSIQLVPKTAEFFTKNARRLGLKADQYDTIDERMAFLMDDRNAGVAKEFLAATKFEAPVMGGMAGLFGSASGRRLYRENLARMQDRGRRFAAADDTAAWITGGDLQNRRRTEDVIATGMDSLRIEGGGDLSEKAREDIFALSMRLKGSGGGSAARSAFWGRYGATLSSEEAIQSLRESRGIMEWQFGGKEGIASARSSDNAGVQGRLMTYDQAERMIDQLEQLNGKRNSGKAAKGRATPAVR